MKIVEVLAGSAVKSLSPTREPDTVLVDGHTVSVQLDSNFLGFSNIRIRGMLLAPVVTRTCRLYALQVYSG